MRRLRALRAPSAQQAFCLVCGTSRPPIRSLNVIHRRCLNTTRPPFQSAAAAVQAEQHQGPPQSSPAPAWSADSDLTAAEKREIELRRERRLAQEATALQQQREQDAARERQLQADLERRHAEEQRRRTAARARAEEAERRRAVEKERQGIQRTKIQLEERARGKVRQAEEARRRGEREQSQNLFADQSVKAVKARVKPIAMPAFGGGEEKTGSGVVGGWGGGVGDIKPIKYAEVSEDSIALQQPETRREEDGGDGVASGRVRKHEGYDQFRKRMPREYDASWNSRNKDSFWSNNGRDQTSANQNISESGSPFDRIDGVGKADRPERRPERSFSTDYRATMFKPSEQPHRMTPKDFDDSQPNTWQHLGPRRHGADPPIKYQQAPSPPPQRQGHPVSSQEEIERSFRAHQQQRRPPQAYAQPFGPRGHERVFGNPNITSTNESRAPRKCARCLEVGHTARECTGPMRATCKVCGNVGHIARNCPNARRDNETARQGSGSFQGVRTVASLNPHDGPVKRVVSSAEDDPFSNPQQRNEKDYARERHDLYGRPAGKDERPTAMPRFEEDEVQSERRPRRDVDEGSERAPRPRFEEPNEDEAEIARRAKRRARGFEDAVEDTNETFDRKNRRTSRRTFDRQDAEADDLNAAEREERRALKVARKAARKAAQAEQSAQINLPEFVSVQNLAQTLGVRYEAFVARLEDLGYDDLFPGKVLNSEMSGMVAMEYNYDPIFESSTSGEDVERDLHPQSVPELGTEERETWQTRPPVVTIMGHVDHGKTTILDYLRKSSIAAGEAGGITQHIGAFSVPMTMNNSESNTTDADADAEEANAQAKTITFLDTPGHAAFLSMRQRGANVTDIVILVVAADDSVKPQTLESLRCAREAGVPILVAINKVDKEGADIQRVKQDLARNGVEIEDFGGEVQVVKVSGKTGQGMESLEEAIVTLSEILDHRADVANGVEGWVLEATTKAHGRVATVLVKRGTLKPGAVLVAGKTWARVKTLRNERGEVVEAVGPGLPVEVDGWRDQASAGDQVLQAHTEQKATSVVEYREEKAEREKMEVDMEAINVARQASQAAKKASDVAKAKNARFAAYADVLEGVEETPEPAAEASAQEEQGQITVPFLLKSDVSGSAEAVAAYIPSISSPLIVPSILSSMVGPVHESDVDLAAAAGGHIIAFNLPANEGMKGAAEARGVKVLEQNVIYRVLDDVREVLEARLPPIVTQKVTGEAEIGAAFEIGLSGRKTLKIAGCKVRNGVVGRGVRARVHRDGVKIYDGLITSLKNVKKDVQEMRKGTECGMGFEGWEGFEVGDLVQCYEEVSEKRRL